MKINLAENLLRFGVKNLSEASRKKLEEQPQPGNTGFDPNNPKALPNVTVTAKKKGPVVVPISGFAKGASIKLGTLINPAPKSTDGYAVKIDKLTVAPKSGGPLTEPVWKVVLSEFTTTVADGKTTENVHLVLSNPQLGQLDIQTLPVPGAQYNVVYTPSANANQYSVGDGNNLVNNGVITFEILLANYNVRGRGADNQSTNNSALFSKSVIANIQKVKSAAPMR